MSEAKINNRFKNLLAQVEADTGIRPTYEEIHSETGMAISTISAYARGEVARFDEKTVVSLINFLNKRLHHPCSLGDMLEYPERPADGQEGKVAAKRELAMAAA